ncbi:MAG: type II toxin-antitoxin system Phd/YefM family antitoxin [Marmoricola sp.]
MKTVSHRELRNQSAQVLREVAGGETYTVTNHGTPVARLSPPVEESDLRCVRPAKARLSYSEMRRVALRSATSEILDDLRGDR